jgi:hypothetical protein
VDETLDLRVKALERLAGVKAILAPRRAAFRAAIGKTKLINQNGGHFR